MSGCSQSFEWSTSASDTIGAQELRDRARLKLHPAKSPVSNCGQQWKLIINAYEEQSDTSHVLSQLWAGCTACILSSFSHWEETVACPDTGFTQTACWHDETELADAMGGCYDFSHSYWEVRSIAASTVGERSVVPLKWSSAFQTFRMHEVVQKTSPALEHWVHR